ncbi:sporulation protein Cse60 [Bacillus sp. PS06]|uniref:sporulation protein Cse60 n=1 Tax=Bacillus sp. PS06 TaxID=2764176 RepID=UPI001784B8C6|nr:sporulation protein Cse60 [Bacillus sp. PS06]MBD8069045.1 sporulation protein Cse60 [Bacillus sp. PS06]
MVVKVRVFDECHEKDLEDAVNRFLETIEVWQLMDIKYQVACSAPDEEDQIYCFSACIIYKA